MMKVVGEEGTSLDDYVVYLKSEFLDAVYLQQNSFDAVDAAVGPERQKRTFGLILEILAAAFRLARQGRGPGILQPPATDGARLERRAVGRGAVRRSGERRCGPSSRRSASMARRSGGRGRKGGLT